MQLAVLLTDELEASISPDMLPLFTGHSMGAQVAFETCRLLGQQGPAPQGLIISGYHVPHLHSERQLSHYDDADFIAELIDIGGCSPELRESQELMSLFLPLLRTDFYVAESYHYDSSDVCPPLHASALLLCDSRDREASWQQVDAWCQWPNHVTGPVVIDGDHSYPIQQTRSFFTQIIRHFPHISSAMTTWQKQPSISKRWRVNFSSESLTEQYPLPIAEQLRHWATRYASRIAVVDAKGSLTYSALNIQVDELAAGLSSLGLRSREHVIVRLPNDNAFITLLFALLRLGVIPVLAVSLQWALGIDALIEPAQPVAYVIHGENHAELARQMAHKHACLRHALAAGEAMSDDFTPLFSLHGERQA